MTPITRNKRIRLRTIAGGITASATLTGTLLAGVAIPSLAQDTSDSFSDSDVGVASAFHNGYYIQNYTNKKLTLISATSETGFSKEAPPEIQPIDGKLPRVAYFEVHAVKGENNSSQDNATLVYQVGDDPTDTVTLYAQVSLTWLGLIPSVNVGDNSGCDVTYSLCDIKKSKKRGAGDPTIFNIRSIG